MYGDFTSDAGMLLLRQADWSLSLRPVFADAIADWHNSLLIVHSLLDPVWQRVYPLCARYKVADDCDTLRSYPLFKIHCERHPETSSDLVSQPAVSRLENRITEWDWTPPAEILRGEIPSPV